LRLALAFPAFGRPPLAAPVSTVEHELEELPVRDRRLRDLERRELHRVRPLLVVEMESGAALGADLVRPAGNFRIALEPASIRRGLPSQRIRVPERLPGVVERLSMHILVEDRQLHEVGEPGIFRLALQTSQYALQNPAAVFQGLPEAGKRSEERRVGEEGGSGGGGGCEKKKKGGREGQRRWQRDGRGAGIRER